MQGQQEQAITFEQKVNILQNITLFPALTIMVFLRRKIGFRFLDLMKIQVMVVLLWAYGAFSSITFGPAAGVIIFLFSLAVLIAANIERRMRWHDIRRGISWHTYSRGISWFSSFLPLSETAIKRFIDPAAALIPGIVLFFFFRPLGLYLILSAVCLFVFETVDYQKQIDRMLDQLDNLVESEVVSDNVEYFQHGGAARVRPVEETAGIPTGTDPDLAAAIERRRARNPKSTPLTKDNDIIGEPPPQTSYAQPDAHQPQTQTIPRRRQPPDNLVITEPQNLPDQTIQKSQMQQEDIATPRSLPLRTSKPLHISRPPLRMIILSVVIIGVLAVSVFGAREVKINTVSGNATATTDVNGTALATHAYATATAQAVATATTLQRLYLYYTGGTPTFDDPLTDDKNNWGILNTDWGGTCAFRGGAYHIGLSRAGYWIFCVCAGTSNLNNFALQVQMSIAQGNEGGILFGGVPNKGYRVYISPSGNYIFYLQTNGQDQTLLSGSSPAIKTGLNQANVITIIVNNSNFYLYANGQFVTSDNLNAYSQGGAGFTAESIDQATDVAFSNAKIWTL